MRYWPRGLRSRLVLAFVAVTMAGAGAAAWSSANSAAGALVTSTQQRLTESAVAQVEALAPQVQYPPDQAELDRLARTLGPDTLVRYPDLRPAGAELPAMITDDLRTATATGERVYAQRIVSGGRPWLLIGVPVLRTHPDGSQEPSGIEVYSVHDLSDVQEQIDGLTRSAIGTAALVLVPAVLLALLAARGVLRPVRELRDTARRLADGDLDARSQPHGADELAELTGTVNTMAESVQESMVAMSRMQTEARRFAADVSHELRTPLSTLTAVMEVLTAAAPSMDADARESAQLAIAETRHLVRLVEELMEISRFDSGTAHLRIEEVDLVAAVRECLRIRGWQHEVAVRAPEQLYWRADPRRLDAIVANLVANALRHGRPPVQVSIDSRAGQAEIAVTDSGPGVPDGALDHVFDRFYKADSARSPAAGSGLGLSIAMENARLHGGHLMVENTTDGAQFVLQLPGEGSRR
ncbi:sensor histidine kinase [Ruania zhangjianzhongii]|uniref:sensor histidine kinase n=1 Tax=Ruania zhangjianzhongii TaxID=2603206 RepID=UPI0011CBF1FE|nr:HAMP domain-containing sensor histidine kinase [Ruania zhangjianzhongii]